MSDLLITRHQRVLLLTLNRPQARNALNNALLTQIADALDAAASDPDIRACVIGGNRRFFAAGADLNRMRKKTCLPRWMIFAHVCGRGLMLFPKPLIAAVNGYALGAGCELALLCDLVVAGDNARFGLPEITLGIMPGAGGTQRLIRCVGKALASRMVLSGESIDAQRAQQAGLVSEIAPALLTDEYALEAGGDHRRPFAAGAACGETVAAPGAGSEPSGRSSTGAPAVYAAERHRRSPRRYCRLLTKTNPGI